MTGMINVFSTTEREREREMGGERDDSETARARICDRERDKTERAERHIK